MNSETEKFDEPHSNHRVSRALLKIGGLTFMVGVGAYFIGYPDSAEPSFFEEEPVLSKVFAIGEGVGLGLFVTAGVVAYVEHRSARNR